MSLQVNGFMPPDSDVHAILSRVQSFHEKQTALCDRLEMLANSLPENFNPQEALVIARQIMPLISEAHRFEENVLFHLIDQDSTSAQSLERLKFEHWEDEASGEDLTDALLSYARSPKPVMTDKLAYMLRGFFDNLRRHIAFEVEHIVPAVKKKALG